MQVIGRTGLLPCQHPCAGAAECAGDGYNARTVEKSIFSYRAGVIVLFLDALQGLVNVG